MSECLHQSCQNWDNPMFGRLVHISQTAAPLKGREDVWGKKNQKWFKAYHATKYLWTLYLKTFCCMKFSNLQNIHFNFVWFLREKKLKIDFNTIIIFYFFQMLSANFLIILTEHVQNLTNFHKKVQFFFIWTQYDKKNVKIN